MIEKLKSKKKILIRIGSLRHGGAEKVLTIFLNNLSPEKYEVDLLLNLNSGKYLKEIPNWIKVYYLFQGEMITTNRLQDIPEKAYRVISEKLLIKFPQILYKFLLKNKKYDVEFAAIHGMKDAILASPNKNSKKLVWIHNDLFNVEGYTTEKIKSFFQFDKIMVISEKIQQLFEDLAENQQQKDKIVRIYNPLDTEEILTKSTQPVLNYKFDTNIPTFVSVGTVFPQKGFDRLIRVHRKLLDEGLHHKVLIIGDGYDFENVRKIVYEQNVQDSLTMFGFSDNPYPYFKHADFFILSSRYEGFPTVLFEAITLQKTIVATDVSGVREMLNDGELGLIVENSEEGIYQGMKKILTEPKLSETYQAKIANFQLPFSLEKSVKQIETIIDEL